MLCRKLRPKPRFLSAASSWLIIQLRFDRNTSPATHFFFSTEAVESSTEGGKELLYSPNNHEPVAGAQDKVELTKTLLKEYGFTNTHLSKLHSQRAQLFNSVPEKTLVPKLEFLRGIGFSNTDLPRFICSNASLLTSSLQNQLVPCFNFIKGLDVSDEIVLKTLKRNPRLLAENLEKKIAPNVAALREAGVPQSRILYLLRCNPRAMGWSLVEGIKKATEMGFNPERLSFIDAVVVFTGMPKSTWDKKMEVLRKCGMTDAQILMAFRLRPLVMNLAEQNIVQTMDFFIKKMGWLPAEVARNPGVIGLSLEKRIIPRCTVVRYLQGKGLLRRRFSLGSFLKRNEKDFLDRFVNKYENDIPGLVDIYLGKISPQEPIL